MKKAQAQPPANTLAPAGDSASKKLMGWLPFILIGAVSYCAYLLLNINTPPFGDDVFLQFEYQDYFVDKITAPRVTGIGQIIEGMVLYYKIFRGRVIAQGLTQLFAVYGKQYFNVLNALAFSGISFLVYYHSNYGKKPKWLLYLMICIAFWFLTPDLMATTLWMAGSLNECWALFFVLLFLVPYRMALSETRPVKHTVAAALFVIPIGFLAGAFNFQSFGLSIGFAFLVMVLLIVKKKSIPVWSIVGLVSALSGTLFVFLAPGNKVECLKRYGYTPAQLFLHNFPGNIFDSVSMSYKVAKVLMFSAAVVLVWLIIDIKKSAGLAANKKKKSKQPAKLFTFQFLLDDRNGLLAPLLFLAAAVASVVVSAALPYVDARLFFTVFVCFALVFFSLLSEAAGRIENTGSQLKNIFTNKYLKIAVPVLICLVAILDFGKEYRIYHRDFVVYNNVIQSIEEKIAAGEKEIVIRKSTEIRPFLLKDGRLRNYIFYWAVTGMGDNPDAMENKWYAYCFGADTIVVTE